MESVVKSTERLLVSPLCHFYSTTACTHVPYKKKSAWRYRLSAQKNDRHLEGAQVITCSMPSAVGCVPVFCMTAAAAAAAALAAAAAVASWLRPEPDGPAPKPAAGVQECFH